MRSLKKVLRDEKGVTMIMVAIAIVVIFGFAVLAIDLSLIQLAKTQLQNAADAAALAGAVVLYTSGGNQDVATAEAIRVAGLNVAVQDIQRPVVIGEGDVTFPEPHHVRVTTHRTTDRGNPVTLYFLRVLGDTLVNQGNVRARATATIFCISGTDCLRPFCPPDRWADVDSNGIWTPDDEYQDLNGNGVWDPGEPFIEDWNDNGVWDPAEFYHPLITGYTAPRDVGVQVTLFLSNSHDSPRMGWYYAVNFGPINTGDPETGGDAYRHWISPGCDPYKDEDRMVRIGDQLQIEPGGMVGPTAQGMQALIDSDPTAEWDEATGTVINSAFPTSPRIMKVAAFDPTLGVQSDVPGRDYLTISKLMVLFVEQHVGGGEVVGRFMEIATEGEPDPDCSSGGFLYTVSLVE